MPITSSNEFIIDFFHFIFFGGGGGGGEACLALTADCCVTVHLTKCTRKSMSKQ